MFYTWVGEEMPSNTTNNNLPINSSQIGGYPALYKDETFPPSMVFGYQIGQTGLMQFFFPPSGACDICRATFRIIPKEDYPKLVGATESSSSTAALCGDGTTEPIPCLISKIG